jgi:xanthine dehydrogenase accessory factor
VILDACTRLRRPAVLATVVSVEGSAYRRPGARMLVFEDGRTTGMVSGGCLEADLTERALVVLREGASQTIVYDMRSPDDIVWGLGLGCDGEIRVLLEALDAQAVPPWAAFAVDCRERRGYAALATVFDGPDPAYIGCRCWVDDQGNHGATTAGGELEDSMMRAAQAALAAGHSGNSRWDTRAGSFAGLVEWVPPRVQLMVFGAGADAGPLVEQAAALDWRVVVLDHREPYADADRFALASEVRLIDYSSLQPSTLEIDGRTAILLVTHHFLHDRTLLERLLETPAGYLGVLGPRRRFERLLEELSRAGIEPSSAARERLHGPVGLDIGSETPQEIALSALAEIQAVMSGREGAPLRGGRQPLHDWPR